MSDILIRGMEMPEDGYRTVEIAFDADGHPMALADGGDVFDVIPVPDHGRLIDASEIDVIGYCGIPFGLEDTFDSGVMWLAAQVDDIPTIIPASE